MEERLRQKNSNIIKVALFGPESTGKTTLAKRLAKHYNTVWVEEYARDYLQEKWDRNREICQKEDMMPIAYGQIDLENRKVKQANKVLFCDTNLLLSKVYSEQYYNGFVDPKLEEAALQHNYDIYFLTYIDTPWTPDDLRDKPNEREEMFTVFKNELEKQNIPYTILKGNREERLKTASKIIDSLLSKRNL